MAVNEIHLDDAVTTFSTQILKGDLTPYSLQGAQTVEFHFQKPDGSLFVKPGVLDTDGSDGKLHYTTVVGDLDQPGFWRYQVYIEKGSVYKYSDIGKFRVFPNLIAESDGQSTNVTGPVTNVNNVVTTGRYADPIWLTSISGSKVTGNIPGVALDSLVVHLAGTETITGVKTFQTMDVASHYGSIITDADAAMITFDLYASDWHQVQIAGNRTLVFTNDRLGQQFFIIIQQDATGSRTVTFPSTILWSSGVVPILTTTPNKRDVFAFKRIATAPNVYLGFVSGLNF